MAVSIINIIRIIIPAVIIAGCASEQIAVTAQAEIKPAVKATVPPDADIDPLIKFFKLREGDLGRASAVVADKQIVKNLTHLQSMDAGGKKYYLLEREAISSMIRSVTKGIYEDCIIINQAGKIIYTMTNNDIFGKNVRTQLKDSPYNRCHQNHDKPFYVDDTGDLTAESNDYYIYFSTTSRSSTGFSGVVIIQVNINEINKVMPEKTVILSQEGRYRICRDRSLINREFNNFSFINTGGSKKPGSTYSFRDAAGIHSYRFFDYANISWIVVISL